MAFAWNFWRGLQKSVECPLTLKALQHDTHSHLRPLKKEMKQRKEGTRKNAQNLDVILKSAKTNKKEKLITKGIKQHTFLVEISTHQTQLGSKIFESITNNKSEVDDVVKWRWKYLLTYRGFESEQG